MEKITLEGTFGVDLHTPVCELKHEGCVTEAAHFYRVHECTSYYACRNCDRIMMETLIRNFHRYKNSGCKTCGKHFTLTGFVDVVELNAPPRRAKK